MRIVCPGCNAEYEVRDLSLRPGRTARCAQCAREWVPVPEVASVAMEPEPDPIPERFVPPPASVTGPSAMDRLAAASARSRTRWGLKLAWVLTIVALAGVGVAFYKERDAIMTSWPPSVRLYAALGLK